jgi:hypothetical protein
LSLSPPACRQRRQERDQPRFGNRQEAYKQQQEANMLQMSSPDGCGLQDTIGDKYSVLVQPHRICTTTSHIFLPSHFDSLTACSGCLKLGTEFESFRVSNIDRCKGEVQAWIRGVTQSSRITPGLLTASEWRSKETKLGCRKYAARPFAGAVGSQL